MPYKDPEKQREYDRLYRKRWCANNAEHKRKWNKANRIKNLEKYRARGRAWYAANRETERAKDRAASRKRLGVIPTREEPAHCEICGRLPDHFKALCLDHCSLLEKFRGWICTHCNLMLGYAKDNPAILIAGAAYLKAAYK